MLYSTVYASPVGELTVASDGSHIVGLWIKGQKYFGGSLKEELLEKEEMLKQEEPEVFTAARDWLDRYFKGEKPEIRELPLAPAGSEFRRTVWKILCEIPYGEVTTYGEIAKETALRLHKQRMSAQAVGGAVGHNPISIIIPCHRIVGTNGSLTGYAGGIDVKIKLLKQEGVDISGFFVPEKGTAL